MTASVAMGSVAVDSVWTGPPVPLAQGKIRFPPQMGSNNFQEGEGIELWWDFHGWRQMSQLPSNEGVSWFQLG